MDLKILDFLGYTYTQPIQIQNLSGQNSTKKQLSHQNSGMVPKMVPNLKINIFTKFQVSIFKNYEV